MGVLKFLFCVLLLVQTITLLKGCTAFWPLASYHIAGPPGNDPIQVQNPKVNDIFEVSDEDVLFSTGITATFLKFTGERRRYVETGVYPNKEYDKIFYIGMFYKTSVNNGTLFHYRAEDYNSAIVKEVKLVLDNGEIKSSIMCSSGVGCGSSSIHESYNSWRFVRVEYTMGDERVQLNGKARIGGSLDNPIGEFVGVFQCVAMLPSAETDNDKWNDYCDYNKINEALCQEEINRRTFNEILVTSIWPLNNRSCGYEGTHMVKPDSTPGLCSTWTSQTHNIVGLEEPSVATLKGNTYIKTAISDGSMYNRFSIAMFVLVSKVVGNPPKPILQVRFPYGYFEYLKVEIDKNKNIIVRLSTGETISKPIGNMDDWHFIAAQYNHDLNELSIIIDDVFYNNNVSGNSKNSFTMPDVELDIGDFEGNIACVTIFNTPLSENTASDLLKQECNKEKTFTAPAEDAPKPVKLWPLSKQTMGFEMFSEQEISTSPTKLCWRFNHNEPTNLIDSEAVQFYGADQFSLLVDSIITSDIFVVGVFVETKGTSGTILKVNISSESVELSINFGNISLIVNGDTCLNIPWSYNNKWVSVVLEISTNELLLNVEDNTIQHSISGSEDESNEYNTIHEILKTPVTLELGGSPRSLIGEMRCLEIFNASIIATGAARSVLKLACSQSQDFTPDLGQTLPVIASNVWRLDNGPISTYKQIHDMELLNSNQSLYFDGSCRLHLLINLSIPAGDMSFGFFFRPMQYTKGLILQDTSSDFHISIDDYRMVIYTRSSCESVTFTGVTHGDWHWLMINRVTSCKSLIFVLDGEVKYAHSKCFEASGMMEVRLGGEAGSFNNYRGDLSCLTVFNTAVDWEVGNDSMVQSCNSNLQDGHFEIDGDELFTNSKFDIIATNSFPSDQGGTISEFYVKSSLACSKTCSVTRYCRSYSLNSTEVFTTCTLFDFITLGGLKLSEGSKYYGILY